MTEDTTKAADAAEEKETKEEPIKEEATPEVKEETPQSRLTKSLIYNPAAQVEAWIPKPGRQFLAKQAPHPPNLLGKHHF